MVDSPPQLPLKYRRKSASSPSPGPRLQLFRDNYAMPYRRRQSSVSLPSSDDCPPLSSGAFSSSPLASPTRLLPTPDPPSPNLDPFILSSPRSSWEFGSAHFRSRKVKHETFDPEPPFQFDNNVLLARACSSEVESNSFSDFDMSEDTDAMTEEFLSGLATQSQNSTLQNFSSVTKTRLNQWGDDIDIAVTLLDLRREVRISPPTETYHREFPSSLPPSSAPTSPSSVSLSFPGNDDLLFDQMDMPKLCTIKRCADLANCGLTSSQICNADIPHKDNPPVTESRLTPVQPDMSLIPARPTAMSISYICTPSDPAVPSISQSEPLSTAPVILPSGSTSAITPLEDYPPLSPTLTFISAPPPPESIHEENFENLIAPQSRIGSPSVEITPSALRHKEDDPFITKKLEKEGDRELLGVQKLLSENEAIGMGACAPRAPHASEDRGQSAAWTNVTAEAEAGPSKLRERTPDKCPSVKAICKPTDGKREEEGMSLCVDGVDVEGERKKTGVKRRHAPASGSRPLTPSNYDSTPPRPRKKRSQKSVADAQSNELDISTTSTVSPVISSSSSSSSSSSRLSERLTSDQIDANASIPDSISDLDQDMSMKADMRGFLIQTMAISRASSMPVSSLLRDVLKDQPQLAALRAKKAWLKLMEEVLEAGEVFGRIEREGTDAAGKPLEPQWFYIPEKDEDQERAALLREMMPKKRSATKKHKQYYYRPVEKITRWDSEDDP